MENTQYVQQFEDFFRERYRKGLEKLALFYPEHKSLEIDFMELDKFAPELADDLLENPDNVIKAAEEAVAALGYKSVDGVDVKPKIRFFSLPNKLYIRNINSMHINKLIMIDGVINKITDVRPKIDTAAFQCIRCGRVYRMPQNAEMYDKLSEPAVCSCERKEFKLNIDETTFVDMQKMQTQEPLDALVRGEQAKNIDIWLEDDLTNRVYPGDKVQIVGILRLRPPKGKSSVYNIYIHAIHVEQIEREFEEILLTEEEETKIKELANDPAVYKHIVDSIAPSIYGHKEIKEALAIQLLGGAKGKILADGVRIRPDIHVLLIGDPGTAKSQLLYYIYKLAPKGVFVGGKSATGAGLTATAEKDDFGEGGWTLKAGALVLASGGQACIDEFDKMGDEDRSSMHEAMEQQRISIAKAGIVTTFRSETAILAAANPKYGRFDPYQLAAEQFNIPPTLLSRFDLIFPIKDVLDEEKDKNMADHILMNQMLAGIKNAGTKGVLSDSEVERIEMMVSPAIEPDLLRKYIAYARKNVNPVLTREATDKIKAYYIDLRNLGKSQGSVAITARQLEALVRLAEGSAKGRLSDKVEIEDAERGIRLHKFVMQEIGVDPETGRMDIDTIATGQSKSRMDKARALYSTIKQLNDEHDTVTREMVLEQCADLGINSDELDKLIGILKKNGDIYSPKHNQFKTAENQKG